MNELFKVIRKSCKNNLDSCIEDILIDRGNMDAIEAATYRMKSVPGKRFAFECMLDSNNKRGDFAFSITRELGERMINNSHFVEEWFKEANSEAECHRIVKFIKLWLNRSSVLYYCIDTIYLELDIGNVESNVKVPGIFFRLSNKTNNDKWYLNMTLAALAALGVQISVNNKKALANSFDKLSLISSVFQVGVMFSRDNYPLKLVAQNVSIDKVREGLLSCGCDTLSSLSDEDWDQIVVHTPGIVGLSLDIIDQIGKRVGIEISMPKHQKYEGWKQIFDWLVAKDYCTTQKYSAVFNWIGTSKLGLEGSLNISNINRSISHLKLDIMPDRPTIAKVYLEYGEDNTLY